MKHWSKWCQVHLEAAYWQNISLELRAGASITLLLAETTWKKDATARLEISYTFRTKRSPPSREMSSHLLPTWVSSIALFCSSSTIWQWKSLQNKFWLKLMFAFPSLLIVSGTQRLLLGTRSRRGSLRRLWGEGGDLKRRGLSPQKYKYKYNWDLNKRALSAQNCIYKYKYNWRTWIGKACLLRNTDKNTNSIRDLE